MRPPPALPPKPTLDGGLHSAARNVHSQHGEDGILAALVDRLGEGPGWTVEFGAWDGRYSNTLALLEQRGWSGVFLETDPHRFEDLRRAMAPLPRAHCVRAEVGWGPLDGLDALLAGTGVPPDFDLLSIDIDGNDYHVWEAVRSYRPRVVVIEHNPTMPNGVDFVQPRRRGVQQGSSLRALVRLGRAKGYELVAVTLTNGIFVREDLFPRAGVADSRPEALRPSNPTETYLLELYDGTLVVAGNLALPWQSLRLHPREFQALPRPLRRFAPGPARRALQWGWLRWRALRHRLRGPPP